MSSLIEDRYRRALRLLPSSYRAQWEEDMVATFLDGAYAAAVDDPEGVELSSPSRAELASIFALAIRLRLGGTDAPPRSFVWGEAVRRVALVGLLAHAISAVVGVAFKAWIVLRWPLLTIPADAPALPTERWYGLWIVAPLVWVAAYLCLVRGQWRPARWLAVVGLLTRLVGEATAHDEPFTVARAYSLMFAALPVVALAAFHQTAPPVAGRRWSWALPAGAVPVSIALLLWQPPSGYDVLLDWAGMWCIALAAGTVVWFVFFRHGLPHWALALAILCVATLGFRLTTLSDYLAHAFMAPNRTTLIVVEVAESAAMLVAAVGLIAYVAHAWRRLPVRAWPGNRA